jgi:hypothetical protein
MTGIIVKATASCPREDCRVELGASTSTCMGWSETYNKYGNRSDVDPNITSQSLRCLTCGARWIARTQYGKTKITEYDDDRMTAQERAKNAPLS